MAMDLGGLVRPVVVRGPRLADLVVVTTGGRSLTWPTAQIEAALRSAAAGRPVIRLLHGGARGADALVDQAARRLGWSVRVVRAQWSLHGRAAGPLRNRQMVQEAVELAACRGAEVVLLAFPGGSGTASCIREARRCQRCSNGAVPLRIKLQR